MAVRIRFGGPELPSGCKTWYDKINEDGTYGGQVFVYAGQIVPAEQIGKIVGRGDGAALVPAYEMYVNAGQASIEAEVVTG